MKLAYYEMRKCWLKIPLLIVLFILLLINAYRINSIYKTFGNFSRADYMKEAYYQIYNDYLKGEITDEKIQYLVQTRRELNNIVKSGNYGKDYDGETLTGYVFSDYILFNHHLVPEVEYAYMYTGDISQIIAKSRENIEIFNAKGNINEVNKNKYIIKLYSGRAIKNYSLVEWIKVYFEYDFSSLLILIMITIGLCSSITYENESGMEKIIKSLGKSNRSINAKLISAAIYIVILTVLFTAFDLILINYLYGIDGLLNPIYSSPLFQYSPLNISSAAAILICLILKLFVFFILGEIALLISLWAKNSAVSVCCFFGLLTILIFNANRLGSNINLLGGLTPYKIISEFNCFIIFGVPILSVYVYVFLYTIVALILFFAIKFSVSNNLKFFKTIQGCV